MPMGSNSDNNFRITLDQKIEHSSTEHLPLPAEALSTLDFHETNNHTDNAIQEALQSLVHLGSGSNHITLFTP